jgi:restriction system protein
VSWEITISNSYLGKSKVVRAATKYELKMKVEDQQRRWSEQERKARERERLEDMKEMATRLTQEAIQEIEQYQNILQKTLRVNDRLKWESLYDRGSFRPYDPDKEEPSLEDINRELKVPPKSFTEIFSKSKKESRLEAEAKAQAILSERKKVAKERYEAQKEEFLNKQAEENAQVDKFKGDFEKGDPEAIEKYVRMVLERSVYPDSFDKEYEVYYDAESQSLVVDYQIPSPDNVPQVVEHRFVQSRKVIEPKNMKKKDFQEFYDNMVYQIALRTLHEVFESVYISPLKSVVFNGWVHSINPSNGQELDSCILSIETTRDKFESIQLKNVDPKQCVRSLKGLFAGALYQLVPIKPILQFNREDSRFVVSRDVLQNVDEGMNLADMDWEDFEHLVRELFSKIFSERGSEVKITQSSRDGGVDAVAFDNTPITGGKYVIQAKRYNNVVPVSAVRDLYGTMLNEGASKGIIVTTSFYGYDSREFAKDKPLTLIDGSNLVHMLKEYGYNAKIELRRKQS